MAEKITPGVVIVNRFTSPGKSYKNYINYIDRTTAVRNDNYTKIIMPELVDDLLNYEDYNEYMGNPTKTTELFTADKDELSLTDKKMLKQVFEQAQKNNSLMWQTVISFDNGWLAENGVYNPETSEIDEDKLKTCCRGCMANMLEKEDLNDTAVWSAAIHYNTDNIHIHIATVEPKPMRKAKMLRTISFSPDWVKKHVPNNLFDNVAKNKKINAYREKKYNANYLKIISKIREAVRNETDKPVKLGSYIKINNDKSITINYNGEPCEVPPMAKMTAEIETQIGMMKQSSIRAGKSFVVNEIANTADLQKNINDIIRSNIYGNLKCKNLARDRKLKQQFINIYRQLPSNRRLWKYGMNAIKELRPQIDALVNNFVDEYNADDFDNLIDALDKQTQVFKRAYGDIGDDYKDNKMQEFYQRCGNAILREMINFDKAIRNANKKQRYVNKKFMNQKNEKIINYTIKQIDRLISNDYEHEQNLAIYEQEFEPR